MYKLKIKNELYYKNSTKIVANNTSIYYNLIRIDVRVGVNQNRKKYNKRKGWIYEKIY